MPQCNHHIISGGSRQVSVVSTKTPLRFYVTELSNLNTLIEHSDRDSLIEQSHQDTLIVTVVFEKVRLLERKKKGL